MFFFASPRLFGLCRQSIRDYTAELSQLSLAMHDCWRKFEWRVIEGLLLNFSLVYWVFFPNRNYGGEKLIVVPVFPSNIRQPKYCHLGWSRRECWQIIEGLLNFSFVISTTNTVVSKKELFLVFFRMSATNFWLLGRAMWECWRQIEWPMVLDSLNSCLKQQPNTLALASVTSQASVDFYFRSVNNSFVPIF